jgi:hypothetical protein
MPLSPMRSYAHGDLSRGGFTSSRAAAPPPANQPPLPHHTLAPIARDATVTSKPQTAHYVDFQISQAGGDEKLFGQEVKDLLHDFTGGLPRAINNPAIACLLQATAAGAARVDEAVFRQAAAEFQLP